MPIMSELNLPSPGYGLMSLSGAYGPADDDESIQVLEAAYRLGCTFWDTASVYGMGSNEQLIGKFLAQHPEAREKLFIGSKCGFEFDAASGNRMGVTNTSEHILSYIDQSIARLGTVPDLYYLHRMDPKVPLEVSIKTMAEIKKAGKTKYIGISEPSAETLRAACKVAHIDFVQIEYSPFCLAPEQNGVLDAARELDVQVVAFSPLGVGILTGKYSDPKLFEQDIRGQSPRFQGDSFKRNLAMVQNFQALAEKKGCSPAQLALAWVRKQGALPIPGTRRVERLEENWGAHEVHLTDSEEKEIRGVINTGAEGARWPAGIMEAMGH